MTDNIWIIGFFLLIACLALYFGFEIAGNLMDAANTLKAPESPALP